MNYLTLRNTTYGFVSNYKHNPEMRASFNKLTKSTYGFDFEFWYEAGYWGENYIPYALLHKDKMVSNVSISKMEFLIENEKKTAIQIGTVMTDKDYRHRGLNKYLMERVLSDWKERVDFIYLFANDTVLDFYPKFNFKRVNEYAYSKSIEPIRPSSPSRKLNLDKEFDRDLLLRTITDSVPVAKVSMRNNTGLIMFYCLSFMKNIIYYLEDLNAVVIADREGNSLHIKDVFSKEQVDLNQLIQLMCDKTIDRVALGFAPLDETGFEKNLLDTDDVLFVFKEQSDYFKNKHWRFPVLSHA
ncbi:GNAT family N-acetyltransferase [Lentiprolixibacter aurantiacus]|uniref:GNAT family N-acetyltransferase n=1 Tax=Lentiprolixibacter aurantiacus TaxID=2993939 RepID=A0AAE3MNA9_9FLAO|nr:GNAT family N-acetyltransferase [Lentiprolixibacter aurantiacus]MCX2720553.1 GNAT family N-acetyltransferase [Lentiprolixibacter aurantiacus]